MALPLKDDFKPGDPISSIDAEWLNTVAKWINNFTVAGEKIAFNAPVNPSAETKPTVTHTKG